jgi:hypothetical protein
MQGLRHAGWRSVSVTTALLTITMVGGQSISPAHVHGAVRADEGVHPVAGLTRPGTPITRRATTERRTATVAERAALAADQVPWRTVAFRIQDLTPATRYEFRDRHLTATWPPSRIHDRYGVPMRIIGGYRRYHPVGLSMLGLKYLSRYRAAGNRLFLDRAQRVAAGLVRIGVSARGGIWFPYRFTWTMHGRADLVNRPPWYSGMAQGLALSFFVRLYEVTGDDAYRVLADRTWASVRNLGRKSDPWVSRIDSGRYLWIEEYPQELDRTFNGHVFALIGVYDYYKLTKDRSLYAPARNTGVLALLRGGLTTIKAYASTFRDPGTISGYCLAHDYPSPKYHRIHIWQLRHLERMTGDRWFGRMADLYQADYR